VQGQLDVSGTRPVGVSTGAGTVCRRGHESRSIRTALASRAPPAVGDCQTAWSLHVTADGETGTVQSRALWVGAAEARPRRHYRLAARYARPRFLVARETCTGAHGDRPS